MVLKDKTQAAGETADKDKTPAEGDTSEPTDQAEGQTTSTGDETPAASEGHDSSKNWVPQERFGKISRERTKALEQVKQLSQENQKLRIENALAKLGFRLTKPEYLSLFLAALDTERIFDPDGELDEGALEIAAGRFASDHLELVAASRISGSGAGGGQLRPLRQVNPWETRSRSNQDWLKRAYGDKK